QRHQLLEPPEPFWHHQMPASFRESTLSAGPLFFGERASRGSRAPTVVVVSQPQPVPIILNSLRDSPGFVRCPHCLELVTTKHTHACMYTQKNYSVEAQQVDLTVLCFRLFCGFCLIPLCMRGLQDAHHSCPQCGEKLYVYER
uniref:LITAF domain-containing protein n=1 Tax=Xiphophorus maculatus TaxID=8083 RepID=A0A3B5PZD2_XIPMA